MSRQQALENITQHFDSGEFMQDLVRRVAQEGLRDCPVYDRNKLSAESRFVGPAIVTQLDATTLVGPGESVQIDAVGSMVIEIGA